jgi:hypothetical protein
MMTKTPEESLRKGHHQADEDQTPNENRRKGHHQADEDQNFIRKPKKRLSSSE